MVGHSVTGINATTLVNIGIYSEDRTSLLASTGPFTRNAVGYFERTFSVSLTRGDYYLAAVGDGTFGNWSCANPGLGATMFDNLAESTDPFYIARALTGLSGANLPANASLLHAWLREQDHVTPDNVRAPVLIFKS